MRNKKTGCSYTNLFCRIFLAMLTIAACAVVPASAQDSSDKNVGIKHKAPFRWLLKKTRLLKLKYYFVAQNTKTCDIFFGYVEDNPLIGLASVDFVFPNGCHCHGHALVTHYSLTGGPAGQKGWIKAKCADGRSLKGHFTTTSLTTGFWEAADSLGNQYEGSFGHTAEEALTRVNQIRKKLNCPECNPLDVELKVRGEILSR